MKKLLAALLVLLTLPCLAQQAVQILPLQVTTTNASGTIANTNTFQSVFGSFASNSQQPFNGLGNRGRSGCFIQNNGTHNMYVFFGATASAATGTSIILAQGTSTTCNYGNAVIQDQISITGTASDAFTALQW